MDKKIKKMGRIAALMMTGILLMGSSCMAEEQVTEVTTEQGSETFTADEEAVEVAGWKITLEECLKKDSMNNVSVELGYTGVETSNYEKDAEEGKVFVLLKLSIEKGKSKEKITWENLLVKGQEDHEYHRIDDTFLEELGMKRMPGTDLNFGKNEGWIAFEVDETEEDLSLEYAFENDTYHHDL